MAGADLRNVVAGRGGNAMSVIITIPYAIDRRLGQNGRLHWAKKHKLTKEAQETTRTAMLSTIYDTFPDAPWILDYEIGMPYRARQMDDDNAVGCLKALRDGIAEYTGVNDKHMTSGTVTWVRDPRGVGYVTVTIRGADE